MKRYCFFVLLFMLSTSSESLALGRISLGIGKSRDSINIYRLGFQKEFGQNWFESRAGHMLGYHEVSVGCWEYERESIQQVAYSPVFGYSFTGLGSSVMPYLEAGIGIGFLSEETIRGRNLSSHFQFEDRGGIGVKIGKQKRHDLSFRYMHYSNAGLWQPNDGIDIFIFSYTFSL
jgi:lipid A 3-O-deacylase